MKSIRVFVALTVVTSMLMSGTVWPKPGEAPPIVEAVIVNDEEIPVPVQMVPREQPINVSFVHSCPQNGFGCGAVCYDVPEDKRLVIEYVSVTITPSSSSEVVNPRILTIAGGVLAAHTIGVSSEVTQVGGNQTDITLSKSVKLYADPGTELFCDYRRESASGTFGDFMSWAISGFLVSTN